MTCWCRRVIISRRTGLLCYIRALDWAYIVEVVIRLLVLEVGLYLVNHRALVGLFLIMCNLDLHNAMWQWLTTWHQWYRKWLVAFLSQWKRDWKCLSLQWAGIEKVQKNCALYESMCTGSMLKVVWTANIYMSVSQNYLHLNILKYSSKA